MAKRRSQSKPDPMPLGKDAAKAVGALLAFYRRLKGLTQEQLADSSDTLKQSSLGMIESGYRRPTDRALEDLLELLELHPFQREQLSSLNDLAAKTETRLRTIAASDVLRGMLIFLRAPGEDSKLLEDANIREVWIVTRVPLTLSGSYYEMLRTRMNRGKISFTYFLNSETGKSNFRELWNKLSSDPQLKSEARKRLSRHLRCILVPPALTIFSFVLFEPTESGKMFGRSVVMDQSGLAIGVMPMDNYKVTLARELLSRVLNRLCPEESERPLTTPQEIPGVGTCQLFEAE
jgi:transcriptional regulator with XRE-family HTH domain